MEPRLILTSLAFLPPITFPSLETNFSFLGASLVVTDSAIASSVMIGSLEVSRQFNNREIFIERARSKILAFFIALKLNYVKITKVLSAMSEDDFLHKSH